MSNALSPRDALAKIPGWESGCSSLRELKGGLTNRTYLVERDDEPFVLRLAAAHTNVFNLDRASENKILIRAAAAGLAPELIYADVESGILLNRYIPGHAWDVADLYNDANIDRLAALLRKVHALPLSAKKFDPNAVAGHYVANLESRRELYAFGLHCEKVATDLPRSDVFVCCHNDVVAGNVIGGSSPVLLDWEYACDNDPMFDLASLIGFHNLDDGRGSVLLRAYAGGGDPVLAERLESQVRLYDAIQWLWLANRHVITHSDAQAARLEELQQRIR
jgi:thiamine kinase-like enzyme